MSARRLMAVASCTAALWVGVVLVGQPVTAEAFGRPLAPTQVTATIKPEGILVTWGESEGAMPPISHYVVHAGPDSCPVTVPASQRSAIMPFIKGPVKVVPQVQAVNAYGFSPAASAAPISVPAFATPGYRNVQFLQFSDFHGAIEPSSANIGAAAMVSALARDRSTVLSSFVVSSGDNIGGSPAISKEFDDIPTIKALNLMKLDISTFGNHEHDEPLARLRSSIELSDFPWVASGYDSIEPLQGPSRGVQDVVVLERGRVKVGFIGLNTADLAARVDSESLKVKPGDQLEIQDGTAKIARLVKDAREQGAQLIVALVHQGWNENADGQAVGPLIDISYRIPGVDVIFGGDSHQQYASILNDRPVAQVPNSGQMYSRTVVCLDTRTNRPIGASIDFVTKGDAGWHHCGPEDSSDGAALSRRPDRAT